MRSRPQPKLKIACEVCGTEVFVSARRRNARFCSYKCRGVADSARYRSVGTSIRCAECGRNVPVSPSRQARTRYCSRSCQRRHAGGHTSQCLQCGRDIYVTAALRQGSNQKRYCSNQCKYAARKGRQSWNKGRSLDSDERIRLAAKKQRATARQRAEQLRAERSVSKRCGKCGTQKARDAFASKRESADGLASWCRRCSAEAKRAWHAEHRGEQNGYSRSRYADDPQYHRNRAKAWRRDNPERLRETQRLYLERNAKAIQQKRTSPEHRAKANERARRWRQKNLERFREKCRREQARRWYAARVNPVSYDALYKRENGICYLCLRHVGRREAHFDHVVPLVLGGTHTEDNIRPTHPRCNLRKGKRLMTPGAFADDAHFSSR